MLAVKLQELFGLADTPRIADGRIPVTLHLLSPAQRPIQVTQDLRGFWERTYAEVKKELKGRYPKHPWPDDPWTATPTRRTRAARPRQVSRNHLGELARHEDGDAPGSAQSACQFEVLFSAGMLPSSTVGDPGIQGAGVAGMHGTGVGTPIAAAVADTKAGLVGDMHMPNGGMLIMGLLSMILAAGWLLVIVRFCGNTTSVLIPGGTANMHFNVAPLQTCMGICVPPE